MNRHIKWLIAEIDQWVNTGIIAPEQGQAIKQRYPTLKAGPAWSRIIFFSIGAILFGLGVILLFAYNWQRMPRLVKTDTAGRHKRCRKSEKMVPTDLDVLTLAPQQQRPFVIDFSTDRWLVEADDKIQLFVKQFAAPIQTASFLIVRRSLSIFR